MTSKDTEIDLLELFVKILHFFRKHFKLFIISFFIGILLAVGLYFQSSKLYKSYLLVKPNTNNDIFIALFEGLQNDINTPALSEYLNLSTGVANKIREIEVVKDAEDENVGLVKIFVTVSDTTIFPEIEVGLKYFIDNNNYLKEQQEYNIEQRKSLIEDIKIEIKKNDSLRMSKNKLSDVYIDNVNEYRNPIVYLLEKKNNLEKANHFSEMFVVLKKFNLKATELSSCKKSLFAMFISLFAGFIIALILEIKEFIKKH